MTHRLGALLIIGTGASLFALTDSHKEEVTPVIAQSAVDGCPETSPVEEQTGTTLEQFAIDSNSGVIYDSGSSELKVRKAGGLFQTTSFDLPSAAIAVCAADFDNDGWADIVGGTYDGRTLQVYKNRTFENQVAPNLPDWNDPTYVTQPKFTVETNGDIEKSCSGRNGHLNPPGCSGGASAISCADFNGDGNADFFYLKGSGDNSTPYRASMFLGNGDGTFSQRYSAAGSLSDFRYIGYETTLLPVDYNGDGFIDVIYGGSDRSTTTGGFVQVFLNDGSASPKFVPGVKLVTNAKMGYKGVNGLAYDDFTGDGEKDLVITGVGVRKIHMYQGLSGGGLETTPVDLTGTYPGGGNMILGADFSLDGSPDFVIAADNWEYSPAEGGVAHYYKSDQDSTPFSGGFTQKLTSYNSPYIDFDIGTSFQYDNDPDGTPDLVIADGNHSSGYLVLANRTLNQYADCGEVESGVLDLGTLAGEEMVVTAARLEPTMTLPAGTSVTFYMTNENPENWQVAVPCTDDPSAYCSSFPKPVGQDVKWKAEMCSNASHTQTPSISGVSVSFDYTEAEEHYRAGVVVNDGVAYVGAFRQPGDSGHFYAVAAGLGQTYWDFADALNGMADAERNIYTSDIGGTTRLDFEASNSGNTSLRTTLGVATASQAEEVINWQRSARFGVASDSKLGSVENSTPAVVNTPGLPTWYPRADETTRQLMDTFIADHADRPTVVLVGSRDGALHAVRSTPTNISDTSVNGPEAWAYIPAKVANDMLADYTNGTASAYPDGSPTVADVILDDGAVHTVAIVSGGNGHKSVFALDITETIDETTGAIIGPQPLWHLVPGGALAGQALSKPVIARVNVSGTSKFYSLMATGTASDNPVAPFTKGMNVVAVDMSTGAIVWQFQAKCPITSDIVIFETDDDLEDNDPEFDGYIDRAVFADSCGYVYKVNPAQNVGTSYIESLGAISTGHTDPDSNAVTAIFSTTDTTCALGAERPIVGTIGARSDSSTRLALFFGTGGIESFDPSLNNAFYAVYADNGEIRGCAEGAPEKGRILGNCTAGVCEKFYGGVVVTASDVIVTRATDAPVGTGLCEFGTSEVTGFSIAEFDTNFSVVTDSATVSSLYGDGGAIYFATLSGKIVKIGEARAENAGDDTANGTGGGQADDDDGSGAGGGGLGVLGWRVVQ